MKTLPNSKRLRFAVYTMHLLVVVGLIGMKWGVDMAGLAAYMGVTTIPLVAYILGETYKPSINKKTENNEKI